MVDGRPSQEPARAAAGAPVAGAADSSFLNVATDATEEAKARLRLHDDLSSLEKDLKALEGSNVWKGVRRVVSGLAHEAGKVVKHAHSGLTHFARTIAHKGAQTKETKKKEGEGEKEKGKKTGKEGEKKEGRDSKRHKSPVVHGHFCQSSHTSTAPAFAKIVSGTKPSDATDRCCMLRVACLHEGNASCCCDKLLTTCLDHAHADACKDHKCRHAAHLIRWATRNLMTCSCHEACRGSKSHTCQPIDAAGKCPSCAPDLESKMVHVVSRAEHKAAAEKKEKMEKMEEKKEEEKGEKESKHDDFFDDGDREFHRKTKNSDDDNDDDYVA